LVEQRIENPRVGGSIPPQATSQKSPADNELATATTESGLPKRPLFCFSGAVSVNHDGNPLRINGLWRVCSREFLRAMTSKATDDTGHARPV